MSTKDLRRILTELQEQIGELDAAKPKTDEERALLEHAAEDIQAALDAGEPPGHDSHASLLDRLKELAERFEDDHPDLTFAVGRLSDMLGKLGI